MADKHLTDEIDAEIADILKEINLLNYSISDGGMLEEVFRIYDILRKAGVEL